MLNVPVPVKNFQRRKYTVEPAESPETSSKGILLAPGISLSSHSINVSEEHVPEYNAMAPFVIVPAVVSMMIFPEAGTVR